jgi:hypothetical protein
MLKLNVGICRKLGLPDYGSAGASVNLEVELPCEALADLPGLADRIKSLQSLCARAVAEQLAAEPQTRPRSNPAPAPAPAPEFRPAASTRPAGLERTYVNGRSFEGTPRTGSALLAWFRSVDDEAPDLLTQIADWGRGQGYSGRIREWTRDQVAAALPEAQRRLRLAQSQEVPS